MMVSALILKCVFKNTTKTQEKHSISALPAFSEETILYYKLVNNINIKSCSGLPNLSTIIHSQVCILFECPLGCTVLVNRETKVFYYTQISLSGIKKLCANNKINMLSSSDIAKLNYVFLSATFKTQVPYFFV